MHCIYNIYTKRAHRRLAKLMIILFMTVFFLKSLISMIKFFVLDFLKRRRPAAYSRDPEISIHP